jgi:hypothetical protein
MSRVINRVCRITFFALGSLTIAYPAWGADLIPYERGAVPDSGDYARVPGYEPNQPPAPPDGSHDRYSYQPGYDSDRPAAAITPVGPDGDPRYRPGYEPDQAPAPTAPDGSYDRYSYQPGYDSDRPSAAMAPGDRYQEGYESDPPLAPPPAYNHDYDSSSGGR